MGPQSKWASVHSWSSLGPYRQGRSSAWHSQPAGVCASRVAIVEPPSFVAEKVVLALKPPAYPRRPAWVPTTR